MPIAEESDVAVVTAVRIVEPTMNDDAVLGSSLLETVIPNRRSGRQLWALNASSVAHEMPLLFSREVLISRRAHVSFQAADSRT